MRRLELELLDFTSAFICIVCIIIAAVNCLDGFPLQHFFQGIMIDTRTTIYIKQCETINLHCSLMN